MEPTPAPPAQSRMSPNEALQRLRFLYDHARKAPVDADQHDACKAVAQELAAHLQRAPVLPPTSEPAPAEPPKETA